MADGYVLEIKNAPEVDGKPLRQILVRTHPRQEPGDQGGQEGC